MEASRGRWCLGVRSPRAALLVGGVGGSQLGRQLPCDAETKYVCLNIDERAPGKYWIRSNIYSSSITNVTDPKTLEFSYTRDAATVVQAAVAPSRRGVSFAYIGGGGYTLPLYFEATYPQSSHLVYEIDDQLVDRVTAALGIANRAQRFPTRIGDARAEVATSTSKSADVVVGDAFSGIAVPWHLTTREFLTDVDRLLRPGGVYVMNLIDFDHYHFVRAEVHTLRGVFGDVVVVAPRYVLEDTNGIGSNVVVLAGHDLPDTATLNAALAAAGAKTIAIGGGDVERFIGNDVELTDEFAPVDQLIGSP